MLRPFCLRALASRFEAPAAVASWIWRQARLPKSDGLLELNSVLSTQMYTVFDSLHPFPKIMNSGGLLSVVKEVANYSDRVVSRETIVNEMFFASK